MTVQEAVLWLKRYQGYEPLDGPLFEEDCGRPCKHKHVFDLTDETVNVLLEAIETGEKAKKALNLSGLLVDGAEMPTGCDECFCCQPDAHFNNFTCGVLDTDITDDDTGELFTDRPSWCPLKIVGQTQATR